MPSALRRKEAAMRSKRLLNIFAALMLIVMMAASGSFAADDYTYNMKVSAGNNGKIDVGGGAKTKVTYEAQPGENFPTLTTGDVQVTNSKYTVIGFKEAGRDTLMQQVPAVSSKIASDDLSYVAVYGVSSGLVKYTVRYLDADGNSLMDDATYYGQKGSQIMVSFKYIEGYAPTAYNLTKTLKADSSENVLAFRYYSSDITAEEQEEAARSTNTANRTAANTAANANANQAANQAAAIDAATPGTPNVVNLDDSEVPLSAPDGEMAGTTEANEENGISIPQIIGIGAIILAILAIVIAIIRRRNAEYEYVYEDEEEDQ